MQPIHDENLVDEQTDDFENLLDDEVDGFEDFFDEEENEFESVAAQEDSTQPESAHAGHRERLKYRLDNGVLGDTELLEWLLFSAIPRRNTNDIAHDLLAKFGSLHAVANAPESELRQIHGVGDSVVRVLRGLKSFGERYLRPKISVPHSLASRNFWDVLHDAYLLEHREVFDVYFINKENLVYRSARFAVGTDTEAFIKMNKLAYYLKRELPHAIIVVHNHPISKVIEEKQEEKQEENQEENQEQKKRPTVSSFPSKDDKEVTKKLESLCLLCGVLLYDHLIFGNKDWYSFSKSKDKPRMLIYYSLDDIIPRQQGGL